MVICPRCGEENIEGADRCIECLEPFRDRDVPQPKEGLQRLIMETPVSELSDHTPVTVPPDTSVAEAISRMKADQKALVLVVADQKLVGIFTERDILLKIIGEHKDLNQMKVRDCMTRAPETVEPTDSLRIALNKMSVGGFRHIPIADEGRVVGLVTAKDALRFLAREVLYK
ncbi:MAG TPA: CBS domain-containing protein [Blastocatellia bacterium]|nr:CBS domain-containing protein [Blastocatellia bacterium]